MRYHPSAIAQAFGTLGRLTPGRVFLGVRTVRFLEQFGADVLPLLRERVA